MNDSNWKENSHSVFIHDIYQFPCFFFPKLMPIIFVLCQKHDMSVRLLVSLSFQPHMPLPLKDRFWDELFFPNTLQYNSNYVSKATYQYCNGIIFRMAANRHLFFTWYRTVPVPWYTCTVPVCNCSLKDRE